MSWYHRSADPRACSESRSWPMHKYDKISGTLYCLALCEPQPLFCSIAVSQN